MGSVFFDELDEKQQSAVQTAFEKAIVGIVGEDRAPMYLEDLMTEVTKIRAVHDPDEENTLVASEQISSNPAEIPVRTESIRSFIRATQSNVDTGVGNGRSSLPEDNMDHTHNADRSGPAKW